MARFFVRCKVEDAKRDQEINAFEYTRCEDMRYVEFAFDYRDSTMMLWELLAVKGITATYGELTKG